MIAVMARRTGFAQQALGRDITCDPPFGYFIPGNVERGEFGKKLQLAVIEMVVDPPRQAAPIRAFCIPIGEPRNNDAGARTDLSRTVTLVPDMSGAIALV